ncbi:MAG: DUF2309 domain-containing protein [Crocinitomicaceae bacterium]
MQTKHFHNANTFDEKDAIHQLAHYLPAQAPLKDFIHHNTLHAFQQEKFHTALAHAGEIFGFKGYLSLHDFRQLYQENKINEGIITRVITERFGTDSIEKWKQKMIDESFETSQKPRIGKLRDTWKKEYKINLDKTTHPILFRVISNYLDQGISKWDFPVAEEGLLASLREIEKNSYISFFKSKRAKKLLNQEKLTLTELLDILIYKEKYYEEYLFDLSFAHPGWSGMVAVLEVNPKGLLDKRNISLADFIAIELLLEIDALDGKFGETWIPLGLKVKNKNVDLFGPVEKTELATILEIWQEAYEWSYYDGVLAGLEKTSQDDSVAPQVSFQALFCIDDRECSIRRSVEQVDANCSTYGTPGHFNIVAHFQPEYSAFHTQICPAPLTPTHLIREEETERKSNKEYHFTNHDHSLWRSGITTATVGLWSGFKLFANIFRPTSSASSVSSFQHMDAKAKLTIEHKGEVTDEGLLVGFTVEEMADAMGRLLISIGLVKDYASLIYLVGHGASSVNNTYYAGYDCGACSGRPGSVNARVAAHMLNDQRVREKLKEQGVNIPDTTQFIGALQDTTRDEIQYFDESILTEANQKEHQAIQEVFEQALDLEAKERSRRFALSSTHGSAKEVHDKVKLRSVSLFEPRPEYNHATNTLCIIGRREKFKNLFLDRRAFMNSYDYRLDPKGEYLAGILGAAAPVCGGINLEYYFSRVDKDRLGAGSKLPHNVMGLIGVANGSDGDLRTGLPFQMVEIHDPMRLLMYIEQFPEVVMTTLENNPEAQQWFQDEWIHLVVLHPESKLLHRYVEGKFVEYHPLNSEVKETSDINHLIESSTENLPVYILKS